MKKFMVILMAGLMILSGCTSKSYKKIDVAEATTLFTEKKSAMLVLASATCTACAEYKPTLKAVAQDKGYTPLVLEINESQTNATEILAFSEQYLGARLTATPTTYIIQNGELKVSKQGALDEEDVESLLVQYGLVSE